MTFSIKLHRSLKNAFLIGSVLAAGFASTPAQAQDDNNTVPVVGTWSRGGNDTVAWVDLTRWTLVTEVTGSPFSARHDADSWVPVAGDWDGDGMDSVRMFHRLTWQVEPLEAGPAVGPEDPHPCPWDPMVGDWDGDGRDTISVYDRRDGSLHRLEEGPGRIEGYVPELNPVLALAGDWDGDRVDTVATVRNESADLESGWALLSGDWDGDGIDTLASLYLETGELVHPEIETELLKSLAGGASSTSGRADDLSGIFAPAPGPGGGGGCYSYAKDVKQSAVNFSCMTIVTTSWKQVTCCPISPTSYICSTKLKMKVSTYGGVC